MPFDTANTDFSAGFAASGLSDLAKAFDAEAPTPAQALANPDAALAFLYLAPQPCAALDALLAA
jgi:hypothetical protein